MMPGKKAMFPLGKKEHVFKCKRGWFWVIYKLFKEKFPDCS